ncbi:MAG: PDDEXK nuclease domain-containing protein [Limisphaerales bacterium]
MSRKSSAPLKTPAPLLADIRELILAARERVAQTVNAGLVTLHWEIGHRIRKDILNEKRAEYGEQIVSALGTRLTTEFGRGFAEKNLRRMLQFAEVFPDRKIVVSLIRQLSWTHFLRLIPIDYPLKLGDFRPGDKGQMELYLRWLDKYERKAGEEAPIGLILCAGKKHETVELLDLEKSGIRVSSYWTEVLPKAELERKLHEAVRLARARLLLAQAGKVGIPEIS